MHILYIDDDAEDREIFKEAIEAIDPSYICNVANDGFQGLKALEEFVVMPDFIFVDVNMPRMNGKQFLSEIKQIPRLRSIPLIMYSTTNHQEEMQSYFNMGAHKVLVKANTFNGVCDIISSTIKPSPDSYCQESSTSKHFFESH
jgi:CheY-like chemotaxis protein